MSFRHFPTLNLPIIDKGGRGDLKLPATHGFGVGKKEIVTKKK